LWTTQKYLPETNIDEEKKGRKEDDIKARKIIIYSGQLQNIKMTKGDIVDIFFMKMSEIRDQLGANWRNHINALRYALVYIICIIFMRVLAEGRNLFYNDGSRGTTHWK
jgi:hypothetical protein